MPANKIFTTEAREALALPKKCSLPGVWGIPTSVVIISVVNNYVTTPLKNREVRPWLTLP
jgi:hypothetical protein